MLFDFIKRFWLVNPAMGFFAPGGGSTGRGGYQITNSLRLRKSASARLSRTNGTPTSTTKGTIFGWFKRGELSTAQAVVGTSATYDTVTLNAANDMSIQTAPGSVRITSQVFRDPAGWTPFTFSFDSTNTAGGTPKQQRLWIGLTEVTAFSTDQDASGISLPQWFASAITQYIGFSQNTNQYFDGFLAQLGLVDGQELVASDFFEQNADGVVVPRSASAIRTAVAVGGGARNGWGLQGSFLLFNDATSTTTLGYDRSQSDTDTSGNNWTLTNILVTAGVTYDVMTDTPTNNFCTLNPLVPATYPGTLSNGNLKYSRSGSGTGYTNCYGTLAITNALAYFEVTPASGGASNNGVFGVAATLANTSTCVGWASDQWGWGWYVAKKVSNATETAYGTAAASGDVLRCAVNTLTGKVWFGNASGWFGSGDPAGGTNETFSGLPSTVFPAISGYTGLAEFDVNFGQRPFTYTPPTGFKSLCTANLPSVAIKNPASHFDAKTRVGTAATYSVTGLGFGPGLVWSKSRGRAVDHALYDYVRGVEKRLESNNTDAEVTGDTTGLTAFNSDGYTGGALDQINGTTASNSFIDWMWKAGGAPSTDNGAGAGNTPTEGSVKIDGTDLGSALAGSIAATRLSANTTAGFSIVTYTGDGNASGTIGHGLGVAPKMIIVKNRDVADSGAVYHYNGGTTTSDGKDYFLRLFNGTGTQAQDATGAMWNDTAPTTTVFSVGTEDDVNALNEKYVAYCFAEIPGFSKFGKYTGNASTDGAFIYTGFRPAFLFIKGLSTGSWFLIDTKRDPYNKSKTYLLAESAGIESTSNADHDILSNGFKLRMGNASFGQSQDFIYAAFAEHPFGGSNVAPSPAR